MNETQIYDKNFAPMPIADLLDGEHHFVIPSFQRGYRWEEKQVTDLLEDIKQFANDDNVKSDSYFLPPVIGLNTVNHFQETTIFVIFCIFFVQFAKFYVLLQPK